MKPERELSEEEKIEGKEKLGRKGKLFLPLGGYFPAAAKKVVGDFKKGFLATGRGSRRDFCLREEDRGRD